jgi:diguanylate cyclase (GGDEF)-like protein
VVLAWFLLSVAVGFPSSIPASPATRHHVEELPMMSVTQQQHGTRRSAAGQGASNVRHSPSSERPGARPAEGAGNGAMLQLPMPAVGFGDQLHRRLSADNLRLAVRLQRLEAELAGLRRALHRASSEASTDPLTGLANRRAFDHALQTAATHGQVSPAQLLLADIDHFKELNDAHGHHFGDAVLCIIGGVFKAGVRRDTLVARLGGDEFALLLPEPGGFDTSVIARRLCQRIAERPLTVRGRPERCERITVSIGLAGLRAGDRPADWYARADAALYAAKRGGRNRVMEAARDVG